MRQQDDWEVIPGQAASRNHAPDAEAVVVRLLIMTCYGIPDVDVNRSTSRGIHDTLDLVAGRELLSHHLGPTQHSPDQDEDGGRAATTIVNLRTP